MAASKALWDLAMVKRKAICPRRNSESNKKMQGPDLLSEVPDELLASIFSRLPVEEAARTSILSHRLKNIWTLNTDALCFDDEEGRSPLLIKLVLNQHRPSFVHSFSVRLSQDINFCYDEYLYEWLLFAFKKDVRNLVLVLHPQFYGTLYPNPRTISRFPCVNALKHISKSVKNGHGLNFLKSLSIGGFRVSEAVVEHLVSICPCLQKLRLIKLFETKHIKLEGPLPSFKHLEILHCKTLETLEISSISLLTLVCYGSNLRRFKCSDDASISALTIGQFCSSLDFSLYSYWSVQTMNFLNLGLVHWEVDLLPVPAWRRIEQLDIRACPCHTYGFLHCCINVIKNFPSLKRLNLGLGKALEPVAHQVHGLPPLINEEFCNESLEVVEFIGFSGVAEDVEIVEWLVRHTRNIQHIIIDLHYPQWLEDDDSFRLIRRGPAARSMAKPALMKLKDELPSNIEFVVR